MQLVRMNIVATRDLDDRTLSHQAFLNDPQLLSRCPPPAPLRAGKYRHSHRVCPLICKSMGKPLTSTANPIGGLHRMRTIAWSRFLLSACPQARDGAARNLVAFAPYYR